MSDFGYWNDTPDTRAMPSEAPITQLGAMAVSRAAEEAREKGHPVTAKIDGKLQIVDGQGRRKDA